MRYKIFWAILIFAVAVVFRLSAMDLMEFKTDEAKSLDAAVQFYKSPYIAQTTLPSSTGVYNMPLFFYLLTIIVLFSKDPLVISFLIAFINSILVPIFYLIVKRYYGNFVGVCASFLMATSPWMILYSRKIWGPDLILLFAIPAFYFIHRLIIDKKPKAIFGLSLCLMLLFQVHFSGVTLALASILTLIIFRIKIGWEWLTLGIMLGSITLIPYLTLGSFACVDCMPPMEKIFDSSNFFRWSEIINWANFESVLGDDYAIFLDQYAFLKIANLLFIFESFIVIWGIGHIFKTKKLHFLLIYLITAPVIAFLTFTPARMYYFLSVSPFIILIYALGIEWFFHLKKSLGIVIITFIIIINIIFEINFYQFLAQKQTISGDYGSIYKVTNTLVEDKLSQVKNQPDYDFIKSEFFVKLFTSSGGY